MRKTGKPEVICENPTGSREQVMHNREEFHRTLERVFSEQNDLCTLKIDWSSLENQKDPPGKGRIFLGKENMKKDI